MERTLALLKPDAVQRQLVGQIVQRIERKCLKIVGLKMMKVGGDLAREMYRPHKGKDFYEPLVEFITASPVVARARGPPGGYSLHVCSDQGSCC